jgi:hypothetical protein
MLPGAAVALLCAHGALAQAPPSTAFTYQGVLERDGAAARGLFEMEFTLWSAPNGGTPIGTVTRDVAVSGGLFTTSLDFGPFGPQQRWLEIAVSEPGGNPETLAPRQGITPTPQVLFAYYASGAFLRFRIGQSPDQPPPPPEALLLAFGPTDDCTIGVDPNGPTGLTVRDPAGLRAIDPTGVANRLLFGTTDDCQIVAGPGVPTGLNLRDPGGIRVVNPLSSEHRLIFGLTDDCEIAVGPPLPPGLNLRDPSGVRVFNRLGGPWRLFFGPTDDCAIVAGPGVPSGLNLRDPGGIRVINPLGNGSRVFFGPTDLCTIGVDGPGGLPGLVARDPSGLRTVDPTDPLQGRLYFGSGFDCGILASLQGGLRFRDPTGFRFDGGFTGLNLPPGESPSAQLQLPIVPGPQGTGLAFSWQSASSRRWKTDIQPIADPLGLITRLDGVRYAWKDSGTSDIGFVAEDLGHVLPELVTWESNGVDATSIDYGKVTALLVEGMKVQQAELDRLQTENRSLTNDVSALRADLERLERLIRTGGVR